MPTIDQVPREGDVDLGWAIARCHGGLIDITCKGCGSTCRIGASQGTSVFQHADNCRVLGEVKRMDRLAAGNRRKPS